mgnify:CR=1 FL=1
MNTLLYDFWKWAEITPQEYAEKGIPLMSEKAEFNYPHFGELIDYAEMLLLHQKLSKEEMTDALTIMALDNENEDVLDYAADNASNALVLELVSLGVTFPQPNTRWQIAELAYRRRPNGFEDFLKLLLCDPDSYVRKRAGNCLEYLANKAK